MSKTALEIADTRAIRNLTALAYRQLDRMTFKQIGQKLNISTERATARVRTAERLIVYNAGSPFKQFQLRNMIKLIKRKRIEDERKPYLDALKAKHNL